ncbi:hypothetical protein ACF1GY_28370 [Streptomyces sp. NPDC014684]|uniref:hypothetical protein n=1 Tax=unclassified Streptomyces TaxID=2593676 RepID=UPI0033EB9DD3
MTAQLAPGNYRCRAIPEAAARAAASGAQWIDTAPNYTTGQAHPHIALVLAVGSPVVAAAVAVGFGSQPARAR